MMIGNSAFFVIWVLFCRTIGPINGWGALQTFGMTAYSIFVFGINHTLFGTLGKMADVVPSGAFDSYLTKPKNLYVRIINDDFLVSAFADLIQGFLGILIFIWMAKISFLSILLLIVMLPAAVLIQLSILFLYDCVIFWLPQAPGLAQGLFNFIMLPSTQPISLLDGPMRFIYLYIIPALVIAGLPIEAVTYHKWLYCLLAYAISITWFLISRWVLKISIHRYESGNSIG
jgi:ABC-type uncharacterized transport system permease subunit